jgi:hypothetical protein
MAYCTISELIAVTGSVEDTGVLDAIIDSADRKINVYLTSKGTSGSEGDATKEASLLLSQAGLLDLRVQKGQYIASSGEMVNGVDASAASDITTAANRLKRDAFLILDQYSSKGVRISRVRSEGV